VTVIADGADEAKKSDCISTGTAAIEVAVIGPRRHAVGDSADFKITIRNVGAVAATNLEVVSKCDEALKPLTEEGPAPLPGGSVLFRIARLEVEGKQTITMVAECVADADNACNFVTVSSGGQVLDSDRACFEILPTIAAPPAAAAPASGLQATIATNKNPAVVGDSVNLIVTVTNTGQQPAQQVSLTVRLPVELVPDEDQIRSPGRFVRQNQEIAFAPIPQLLPNQPTIFMIPASPTGPGQVRVEASVSATGVTAPVPVEPVVINVQPRTP
jgi:uncharacterized repeat protein (TIGR01451 family)